MIGRVPPGLSVIAVSSASGAGFTTREFTTVVVPVRDETFDCPDRVLVAVVAVLVCPATVGTSAVRVVAPDSK